MRPITFNDDPHRQKHFAYFNGLAQPHFGVTVQVDITEFLFVVRNSAALRFTPAIVYLIGKAAMEVRPFRWRIRGESIVEHDTLRPSFAVPTAGSSAFSFCTVRWREDALGFCRHVEERMEAMRTDPSFEDEEGADDYLFLSTFPWATFTSITHAMPAGPSDSIPRIVWGKYVREGDRTLMPLAVQAHHAVVDGSDLGKYYQVIQRFLKDSGNIFKQFTE